MVRYIDEEIILQIIKDKGLLDELQITNLVIDNELMIDILCESLSFHGLTTESSLFIQAFLDSVVKPRGDASNSLLIKNINGNIYDYSRFKEYIMKGYFIYEDHQNNKVIAINDLRTLFLLANTKNSIRLIKKSDFYKALENNLLLFSRALLPYKITLFNQKSKEFPIYTILIPLYKETGKLKSIIKNISLLNYPKDKLDVKIIIEADDYLMIKEIRIYDLPSYIHVLQVPVWYKPNQTKPNQTESLKLRYRVFARGIFSRI